MPYLGNVPSSFNVDTNNINNGAITTEKIADGAVVNADVSASAAIAGTKISPDFGSQNIATTGLFSHALGTAGAPTITFTGDVNTGIYSPGADQVAISTGGSGRLFVDASGRILVGNSATTGVAGFNGFLQLQGTNFDTATVALTNVAANNTGSYLLLGKARGGTLGGYTSVNNGDNLGQIRFMGADGTGYVEAAYIGVTCNGVPGTNNMPGRLFFSTNSGTSSVTERMCITPSGLVGVGTSTPQAALQIGGSTSTGTVQRLLIACNAGSATTEISLGARDSDGLYGTRISAITNLNSTLASNLTFSTNDTTGSPTERVRIDSSGRVGIGTSSPDATLHISKALVDGDTLLRIQPTSFSAGFSVRQAFTRGSTDLVRFTVTSDAGNADKGSLLISTSSTTSTTNPVAIFTGDGRVGIGTSSPSSALHVVTSGAGQIRYSDGTVTGAFGSHGLGDSVFVGSGAGLRFTTNGLGSSDTKMFIDTSGRVGIGTTNPSTPLDIRSDSAGAVVSLLKLNNNAAIASGKGVKIEFGLSDTSTASARGYIENVLDGSNGTYMAFGVNDGTTGTFEAVRIDRNRRLLVGTSSTRGNTFNGTGNDCNFQLEGTTFGGSSASFIRNSNNSSQPYLVFGKTRGTAVGGTTVVNASDSLGTISFQGSDGTELVEAASITAAVDGTPGANDMPGALVFSTTADGASSPTERMRIDSSGRLLLGTATTTNNIRSQSKQAIVITGDTNRGGLDVTAYVGGTNTGAGPQINLQRSIGTTDGSMTALTAAGWRLGAVNFFGSDGTSFGHGAAIEAQADDLGFNANDYPTRLVFATTADGSSSPTERFRINNAGSFSAVIPSGSTLFPAFFTRAWVNFNGTSTVSIRANGNVSSITDNGTGDYTVNFTTAMPDANYSFQGTASQAGTGNNGQILSILASTAPTTTAVQFRTQQDSIGVTDSTYVCLAIFR